MGLNPRISGQKFLWGCVALFLLFVCGYCSILFYQTRPRQIIVSLLRLESAPSSIRNAACESWGLTDVLTTCYFDIKPTDFPALLRGWTFRESPADAGSHSFASGPQVGPDFPVTAEFSVQNTTDFPNGGHVILVVNEGHTQVQIDYYEE